MRRQTSMASLRREDTNAHTDKEHDENFTGVRHGYIMAGAATRQRNRGSDKFHESCSVSDNSADALQNFRGISSQRTHDSSQQEDTGRNVCRNESNTRGRNNISRSDESIKNDIVNANTNHCIYQEITNEADAGYVNALKERGNTFFERQERQADGRDRYWATVLGRSDSEDLGQVSRKHPPNEWGETDVVPNHYRACAPVTRGSRSTQQFSCDICKSVFKRKYDLKTHIEAVRKY